MECSTSRTIHGHYGYIKKTLEYLPVYLDKHLFKNLFLYVDLYSR